MIAIRRYCADDHDVVWELHNVALACIQAHAGINAWDDDLNQVEDVYINAGGEFYVGELDGEIVAMGALKRDSDDRAEVKRMRVHPDHQRKGYGQMILSALENRAKALGFSVLFLDTAVIQEAARGLYEKNGFRETGRQKIGDFDVVLYEKLLG